jgi:hypothetical protein
MMRAAGTLGLFVLLAAATPSGLEAASHVAINEDMVLVIDNRKVFPIGFTMPPPADALAPNGKNAIAELSDAGATFLRTGVMGKAWDDGGHRARKEVAGRGGEAWDALLGFSARTGEH